MLDVIVVAYSHCIDTPCGGVCFATDLPSLWVYADRAREADFQKNCKRSNRRPSFTNRVYHLCKVSTKFSSFFFHCEVCCLLQDLLSTARFAVHCKVCCTLQGLLFTARFAVHRKVCCTLQGLLSTARFAVHRKVCCTLQGLLSTARLAVHCKVCCTLQGLLSTARFAVEEIRHSFPPNFVLYG